MAEIELRVRLIGGDRMDVTYAEPDTAEAEVAEHAISALGTDSGVLRSRHGDRLVVFYGRGVATLEVIPPRCSSLIYAEPDQRVKPVSSQRELRPQE